MAKIKGSTYQNRTALSPSRIAELKAYLRRNYVTENVIDWCVENNFRADSKTLRKAVEVWFDYVEMYVRNWPDLFRPEYPEALTREGIKDAMYWKAAGKVERHVVAQSWKEGAEDSDTLNILRVLYIIG